MACQDCYTGYLRNDKDALGSTSTVYGLKSYIAEPPSTQPTKGIIVFVPDAFGWEFMNNRLLADTYAAAGFRVYLPDFMEGVPVPTYMLHSMDRLTTTSSVWDIISKPYHLFWVICAIAPFTWRNLPGTSHPRVISFLEKLKTKPMEKDRGLKVGVAGFCWGGKHVVMLTHKHEAHLIDACFTAHPSALSLPRDIDNARMPISIAVGDRDSWLTPKQTQEVQGALKKLETQVEGMHSEVIVYEGAGHGFSVRIDIHNAKQVEQSREAEDQAIRWFEKFLK